MNRKPTRLPIISLRAARLFFHMFHAILIACIYPALGKPAQRRILQHWSRSLPNILNAGGHAVGHQPIRAGQECLFTANHISWLDMFAMNTSLPAAICAQQAVANPDTFHQSLTCSSFCGNNASLNSLSDYLGDDDAEPDPAATPAA
ncbi:MAG: hypothetical protein ACLQHK_09275 [Gallionellaceae bacterium]